jgi:hypothetical protein
LHFEVNNSFVCFDATKSVTRLYFVSDFLIPLCDVTLQSCYSKKLVPFPSLVTNLAFLILRDQGSFSLLLVLIVQVQLLILREWALVLMFQQNSLKMQRYLIVFQQ